MQIVIQGRSIITYHKAVEVTEDEFGELVTKARSKPFDTLRDWVGVEDVIDEEPRDEEDWTIEGPNGIDALDG
jgi:hypothetical protein